MLEIVEFLFAVACLAFVGGLLVFVASFVWALIQGDSAGGASPGTYSAQQRTAVRPTPEASKRRFGSKAEAEQAVARSQADFGRGGPRTGKYAVPLDHAYEVDGVFYVSSKPEY